MNTTDFLSIANAICPERDCTIFDEKRWRYADIDLRVNRLADVLTRTGVRKGDSVGMLHVNCNQYLEAYFASAKLAISRTRSITLSAETTRLINPIR